MKNRRFTATLVKRATSNNVVTLKEDVPMNFVYEVDPNNLTLFVGVNEKTGENIVIPAIWATNGFSKESYGYIPLECVEIKLEQDTEDLPQSYGQPN